MIESAIQLLRQLEDQLPEVSETENAIDALKEAIHLIELGLHQLRKLSTHIRENKQDEVYFYKVIAPTVHGHLIYYVRLYELHTMLPKAGASKKLLKKEQKRIVRFFAANESAYRYFKTGDGSFDPEFFQYQAHLFPVHIEESAYFVDPATCTPLGLKFARFMAYERLLEYIASKTGSTDGLLGKLPDDLTFVWSDKKINLEQLCYALAYSGSVNNGNVQVKSLARVLGMVFRTDLSNIHRSKQNMYTRKNEAAYLEYLIKCFKQALADSDDKYNNNSRR